MNNNPIGIFDSGVGGLSVFSRLIKQLPNENYIYFGDTLNLPYGSKTKEELIRISTDIFNFFKSKNVKAVVMACNTTSAIVYDILKSKYDFKIYPIVQNAAKKIAQEGYKKIGVFATTATVNSHAYKNELQKYGHIKVYEIACPEWVSIVENSLQKEEQSKQNIKMMLDLMLENNVEKVILGCTHYPYLLRVLTEFVPGDIFIDPSEYFVNSIVNDLLVQQKANTWLSPSQSLPLEGGGQGGGEKNSAHKLIANIITKATDYSQGRTEFYVSSNPEQFKRASELFYRVDNAKLINITAKGVLNGC